MKVTLNWLKQYVDFSWSPDELADRLTRLGLEVEGRQRLAGEFEGIVVAQILASEKHPNADKLSVCRVADGQGERRIVCGAHNYQVGDKVPLILPGQTLPAQPGQAPVTIKAGRIRGVESQGMLCSPQELGLAEEAEGLLILPADAVVGQPLAQHLGRSSSDEVYDLEITPNRPDLNSVIGVAREIAAVTGRPLRLPPVGQAGGAASAESAAVEACADLVAVRLEAPDLCPRYTARLLRGVRVGPSPTWLRTLLEKVGLRSINNVVDVTNYVMLEVGQPLHAFDYHLLKPASGAGLPTIVVRRALAGELLVTLDGQKHTLTDTMLLIADETQGVALAGIMGGLNTEIQTQTTDVLLEAAYFLPTNIRRTAKALGLATDASYRFERGADIGITDWASRRAADLILEVAGGRVASGAVDAYPQPVTPHQITLRHAKANALLGTTLPPQEMEYHLGQLGLRVVGRKPQPIDHAAAGVEPVTFAIPTFRPDLKREADLIEEIARLHGVEKIPSTPPRNALGANAYDALHDQIGALRGLLTGLGLHEAQGQTLIADHAARWVSPEEALVFLANPLSSDMNVLRPSLLPGLLEALRQNARHKQPDVALCEMGRVFAREGQRTREERHLALALTGRRAAAFWQGAERDARFDLYDLKGLLEELFDQLNLRGVQMARRDQSTPFFLESAAITLGGKLPLGELGQLQPQLARQNDLRDPVLLAELNLDQLLARRNPAKSYRPWPTFPAIRRDVALLVSESITHDAVLAAVRQAKPAHLESIDLFDVYRGQPAPAGQKSMAYAFTYRHPERTLTDAEVNAAQEKLVRALKERLPATTRE